MIFQRSERGFRGCSEIFSNRIAKVSRVIKPRFQCDIGQLVSISKQANGGDDFNMSLVASKRHMHLLFEDMAESTRRQINSFA